MAHYSTNLNGPLRVRFEDGKLVLKYFIGGKETFVPTEGMQFRKISEKDPPHPIASVVLITPNAEGRFIQFYHTVKYVPTWLALTEIALGMFVYASLFSILLYAPFWLLGGLSRRRRRPAERGMRLWPLLAVLCMFTMFITLGIGSRDPFARLGHMTSWSLTIFLLSIAFAVASIASAIAWLRADRRETRRSVRVYSLLVTLALLIATTYLAYWGVIGVHTWA